MFSWRNRNGRLQALAVGMSPGMCLEPKPAAWDTCALSHPIHSPSPCLNPLQLSLVLQRFF